MLFEVDTERGKSGKLKKENKRIEYDTGIEY